MNVIWGGCRLDVLHSSPFATPGRNTEHAFSFHLLLLFLFIVVSDIVFTRLKRNYLNLNIR